MIEMHDLSKVYRTADVETTALNGVNLEIKAGEFIAIMGPSGCGKSTLLNVIGMLDTPAEIEKKFKRAVTDNDGEVRYDPGAKPGVSNLLDILGAATGRPPSDVAGAVGPAECSGIVPGRGVVDQVDRHVRRMGAQAFDRGNRQACGCVIDDDRGDPGHQAVLRPGGRPGTRSRWPSTRSASPGRMPAKNSLVIDCSVSTP